MTLNNIKTKNRGFTIVELLIVIVIIAILAAITIVAYNGIQNRAKTSSDQSLVNSVQKKAEAYNAITSQYPSYAQLSSNSAPTGFTGSVTDAKLDNSSIVTGTDPLTDTTAKNGQTILYQGCGTTGGKVGYLDYTTSPHSMKYTYLGDATSATTGCA